MIEPSGGTSRITSVGTEVAAVRLAVAVCQAVALVCVFESAAQPVSWPATQPALFTPLLATAIYTPLLLILGAGSLTTIPLTVWALLATPAVAMLGWNEATRGTYFNSWDSPLWSRFAFWVAASSAVFVAHVLVVDAVAERRLFPSYRRHFETGWKTALQLVLAAIFVGMFWGILELTAQLFDMVGIDLPMHLLRHDWFLIPAITLALALAIHATDVQPAMIRGTRSIILALFSWLLPLIAIPMGAFVSVLPFVSLPLLWRTHFAADMLLTAALVLIFLINCAYQDGTASPIRPRIKRVAATLGAIELVPLVALAGWAMARRVGQYGWSVPRVWGATAILIAGFYALGYTAAAIRSPVRLRWLGSTNFIAAWLLVAVVLLLFSPLADPARLTTVSQVARLRAGIGPQTSFDFQSLRFYSGRWGAAAVAKLASGHDAWAEDARAALAQNNPMGVARSRDVAETIMVYPHGRSLPADFQQRLQGGRARTFLGSCASWSGYPGCVARYVPARPGPGEWLVVMDQWDGYVFAPDAAGSWQALAHVNGGAGCLGRSAIGLSRDDVAVVTNQLPALVIGSQTLVLTTIPRCG